MRVLFDTNVVLDVLLAREPHAGPAARLFAAADSGEVVGFVGATTVTTIYYLAAKAMGKRQAADLMDAVLDVFEVAPVDGACVRRALSHGGSDFEDAVLVEAAVMIGANAIITRDPAGFRGSSIPCLSPMEMRETLRMTEDHVEVVTLGSIGD